MASKLDARAVLDWPTIRDQAAAFITTEYASLNRGGAPITWPVTPYLGANGRSVDVTTGLTYPLKAERARRNPKVSLSFSQPLGSRLADPATFVIQGLATVHDADLRANSARYLAEVAAHLPEAFDSIPTVMLRRMAWYWARIWIEVTPVRVLWWRGGDLDQPPQLWEPQTLPTVAPSDPAPVGRGAGSWNTRAAADWRTRIRGALDRLGPPVLTSITPDGWPLPLRVRNAEQIPGGFRMRPPVGVDIVDGPACLTFHTHGPAFESQENASLTGHCRNTGEHIEFDVERALNDFIIPAKPLRRAVHLMSASRRLKRRLDSEARRRGQRVPRFDELGFTKSER
ncbi:hypothetical protein PJK45_09140 [Mycobacterium kansasii]|uniref:Hemerythrin n=3 Tax=Mycobacterium kansasii TaxID=1768 RepID=U5WLN4_MYCKA|nr:hypothetical protein [Mycobacterium kansasii]ETZ99492.1 putative hemerythrin HHE cation binding domain-containing protein [Mycobacterium kansasii 824]AGZ48955.1 hemerythrin [Mycobacterium kansasii ATCC 12478]ARG59056.1 hypothetical protein B1T43_28415 [Mycobacterium kansasii]ARG72224.1 hypothetical protein B1T47_28360 [Mycobacterium kansasii]ARG73279.1 hypothetical protein B1T51_00535 [Mycobacterium kansasii]